MPISQHMTGAQPRYTSNSAIVCLPISGVSCCNRKSASSMTARTVPPADACQIFTMFGFANSPSSTPVEIDFPSKGPIILVVGSDVFRSVRGGQSSAERKPDDECLMFRSTRCRHELL